jgi:5-methylcytosine-specific restriction endonuclease McrA
MARDVEEWVGASDDSAIPLRVRLRVFDRCGGVCHISGAKIRAGDKWEMDHVLALRNGGRNCESNLAPALTTEHRKKTASDVAQKSKDNRVRAKHFGLHKPKAIMPGSKASRWKKLLNGSVVLRDREPQ